MRSRAYVETQTSVSGGRRVELRTSVSRGRRVELRTAVSPPMVSSSCPFRTEHPVLSFASRSLARAIRIKYKIYLPARETPPPRCWLDTEIDSRVTMQSITVPNQQIGGRLPGAHPVYTRMRVSSFTSREYLWRNGRFNGSQRSYYGESAY